MRFPFPPNQKSRTAQLERNVDGLSAGQPEGWQSAIPPWVGRDSARVRCQSEQHWDWLPSETSGEKDGNQKNAATRLGRLFNP